MAAALTVCLTALLTACGGGAGPVEVRPPAPTGEVAAMCADLIRELPATVATDLHARDVEPSDASAAAWGEPAVVLRCGVAKPAALVPTSACFQVNGVGWLATQGGRELSGDRPSRGTLTFTTIGRAAYVEVTVPPLDDHQPADPLPALAAPIKTTIPATNPCQ